MKRSAALVAVALAVLFILAAAVWGALAARAAAGRPVAGGAPAAPERSAPEPPPVDLEWPAAACYPRALVADCLAAVRPAKGPPAEYGPAGEAERARLAAAAADLGRRHGVPLRPAALESVRNIELAHAARTAGVRAQRFGPQIAAARRAGTPIVDVARRFRLPPLAALKQALVEEGHGEAAVKRMVARPDPALEAEVRAASEADLGSALHAGRARTAAQAFEEAVAAHLRARGAAFETEESLRASPPQAAPLTPDVLFTAPTRINGRRVCWLDAKNYPGVDSPLLLKSLKRQAAKYTARFGPGAFVFSGGYACGSALEPLALLLDGSHLA